LHTFLLLRVALPLVGMEFWERVRERRLDFY
jgi:hypothetical protein